MYDGNRLLDLRPGRSSLAGLSFINGGNGGGLLGELGGRAEDRRAEVEASQAKDAGRLEAIYQATNATGFTDAEAESAFLRSLAPLVSDLMGPLELSTSQDAAAQVRDALAAGSANALRSGRAAIDNTLTMWRETDTTPYAKSIWQAALTSSIGDAVSKAVMYTGAAFSSATGFNAKAIEAAYRKAAGRDAETIEAGREAGAWGAGWIKWAALGAAVLIGLGYAGGRRG